MKKIISDIKGIQKACENELVRRKRGRYFIILFFISFLIIVFFPEYESVGMLGLILAFIIISPLRNIKTPSPPMYNWVLYRFFTTNKFLKSHDLKNGIKSLELLINNIDLLKDKYENVLFCENTYSVLNDLFLDLKYGAYPVIYDDERIEEFVESLEFIETLVTDKDLELLGKYLKEFSTKFQRRDEKVIFSWEKPTISRETLSNCLITCDNFYHKNIYTGFLILFIPILGVYFILIQAGYLKWSEPLLGAIGLIIVSLVTNDLKKGGN